MKKIILAMSCVASLLISSAPAQDILALHPAFTEPSAVLPSMIEGTWGSDLFAQETVSFEKAGDNFYVMRENEQGRTSLFEAVFTRLGETLILDLFPIIPDTIGTSDSRKMTLPAHLLCRVNLEKDALRVASLGYGWFYSNVLAKGADVPHTFSGTSVVLTMPTPELRGFIAQHANEPGFFSDDLLISRKGAPQLPHAPSAPIAARPERPKGGLPVQACLPAFPMKDGWLGGDGDLSVPWAGLRSLWIFADTFVGERTRTSRSGANMIPNTAAVSACGPTAGWSIDYFWRDAGSPHPRPVFESFTERYKYWPCGAFMSEDDLYVPLLKIGPKPGASPADIFNFTGVGMSLARIARAADTRPDQWAVELLPWSQAFDPDHWGCCVLNGGFLYFFERGKNETVVLRRLSLGHLRDPSGHVESFSADRAWRNGDPPDNAMALFQGEPGNSVTYHPETKKWVMVCGPGFLTNKIRLRTAPALEGPWAAEKVVFECPEMTPGSPAYDKDNFCYGGREHPQFYDAKTRSILITYDCNTADFRKGVTNLGIYTARVVRIPLDR